VTDYFIIFAGLIFVAVIAAALVATLPDLRLPLDLYRRWRRHETCARHPPGTGMTASKKPNDR
jgi:hypothetical protein